MSVTPGPWVDAHNVSHEPTVRAKRLNHSANDNGGFIIATFHGPDARENARLCSAAPELLWALDIAVRKLEACARLGGNSTEAIAALTEEMHAAISKAKGS